jgi:hypothetical protein
MFQHLLVPVDGSDGAVGRNRTGDLLITNQLLYQLSYNSEVGETRGGVVTPFDSVNDHNGLAGITTGITGTAVPPGYSAAIAVAQDALGPGVAAVPAAASLRITVTVSFGNENLTVEGYRTRYAPNSLP